jgi:hypothetical protein
VAAGQILQGYCPGASGGIAGAAQAFKTASRVHQKPRFIFQGRINLWTSLKIAFGPDVGVVLKR